MALPAGRGRSVPESHVRAQRPPLGEYRPDEYPRDEYPPDEYRPDEYPRDEYPRDEYPPDEYPPDEYPPDEYPPDEYPPDEYPPDEYPPDEHPPDEYPPDEHPPDEYPPDEHPPDEHPPDEYPPDEYPPDEYPPDEYPPDEYPPDEYPPGGRRSPGFVPSPAGCDRPPDRFGSWRSPHRSPGTHPRTRHLGRRSDPADETARPTRAATIDRAPQRHHSSITTHRPAPLTGNPLPRFTQSTRQLQHLDRVLRRDSYRHRPAATDHPIGFGRGDHRIGHLGRTLGHGISVDVRTLRTKLLDQLALATIDRAPQRHHSSITTHRPAPLTSNPLPRITQSTRQLQHLDRVIGHTRDADPDSATAADHAPVDVIHLHGVAIAMAFTNLGVGEARLRQVLRPMNDRPVWVDRPVVPKQLDRCGPVRERFATTCSSRLGRRRCCEARSSVGSIRSDEPPRVLVDRARCRPESCRPKRPKRPSGWPPRGRRRQRMTSASLVS